MVSLSISEWGSNNHPLANFYIPLTRAWELFLGSIAALIIDKQVIKKNNNFALLGLSLVVFSVLFFDKLTPFPSFHSLIPILGTLLLILFAQEGTLVARFLSIKLLVGLGLISYSAYLWHQPLLAIFRVYKKIHRN